MRKKILFLGGSSLLAHSWCNQLHDKEHIIIGLNNRKSELDGFNSVKIDFSNLKNQIEKSLTKNKQYQSILGNKRSK